MYSHIRVRFINLISECRSSLHCLHHNISLFRSNKKSSDVAFTYHFIPFYISSTPGSIFRFQGYDLIQGPILHTRITELSKLQCSQFYLSLDILVLCRWFKFHLELKSLLTVSWIMTKTF